MKNLFQEFYELHQQPQPLLVGNVWDVQSAKVFEQQQYKAIATSSAAIAATLGYDDNQSMPFEDYLFIVKRIAANTSIPFSVDIEAGYGNTDGDIFEHIKFLQRFGVSGVNIEDSIVTNNDRSIADPVVFADKIQALVKLMKQHAIELFINIRCDSFLLRLPNAVEDALQRAACYQATGAHGLFFPCITKLADMAQIVADTSLPVSVMCMPGLPAFEKLQEVGIKRISQGPFVHTKLYQQMQQSLQQIESDQCFNGLF